MHVFSFFYSLKRAVFAEEQYQALSLKIFFGLCTNYRKRKKLKFNLICKNKSSKIKTFFFTRK